ncbi:hypothetical protein DICA1_C06722 [Diutina catenulata]
MRNIQVALQHPSVAKWVKWVIVLLAFKAPRAPVWSSFLALNPLLADITKNSVVANGLSSALLLGATYDNYKSPNDYLFAFAASAYAPKIAKKWFPVLFGVLLSQFLSKGNIPATVSKYFLTPVWLNFAMGPGMQRVNLTGLGKLYVKYNIVLAAITGLVSHQRVRDEANERGPDQAFWYLFHKSNAITNLIFAPNVISFVLLGLAAPFIPRLTFLGSPRNTYRWYTGVVGAIAAFITLKANDMGLVVPFKYRGPENVRHLSESFVARINMYVARLLVVTRWRQFKVDQLVERDIKLEQFNRGEAIALSALVFHLFNTYDGATGRLDNTAQKVRANEMFKLIGKLKH